MPLEQSTWDKMLVLSSTSDKINLLTSSTADTDVQVSYGDMTAGLPSLGRKNTSITTATTTDISGSPAASTQRNIKHISIRNKHASTSQTITIQHTDGVSAVEIFSCILDAGWHLTYDGEEGFRVYSASGSLKATLLNGVISPAQITSNQNNYDPPGLATAGVMRLSSDTTRQLTGLARGSSARVIYIHNVGSFNIVLVNESGSSSAENRFAISSNEPIPPNGLFLLQYDSTSARWRSAARHSHRGSDIEDNPSFNNATLAGDTTASGAVALSGIITPSQITSNQNDYDPTGLSGASTLRLSTDASRNITGLAGGIAGRILLLYNVGANGLYLKHEDAGSSAANRFSLGQNIDVSIAPNSVAILQYDGTSSRWRSIIAGPKSWVAVPTLQNSWVNYGSGLREAEYMKDAFGRVWVRGTIKNGSTSSGVLLWTFGSGYIPTGREIFMVVSNGLLARVDVLTDGTVIGYNLNASDVTMNFSYSTLG